MQKSYPNTSRYNQLRFKRMFKRKVFLSNELKKSILISIVEAKNYRTFVNLDLFLYGLFSEPTSLSARLFTLAISQFQNNKKLTPNIVCNKIYDRTSSNLKKRQNDNVLEYSVDLSSENNQSPWLSTEVKDLLKEAVLNSLQTKRKITVLTTKHIFLELLNKDSIREFLRQLLN